MASFVRRIVMISHGRSYTMLCRLVTVNFALVPSVNFSLDVVVITFEVLTMLTSRFELENSRLLNGCSIQLSYASKIPMNPQHDTDPSPWFL